MRIELNWIIIIITIIIKSRDSVVGIATGYGLDSWGVRVRVPIGSRIFSTSSRPALGPTQPPIQWVPRAIFRGKKWLDREAHHSPPTSAEVKKTWMYTSSPSWCAFILLLLLLLLLSLLYSPLLSRGRLFFGFFILYSQQDTLDGGSARRKDSTYTQNRSTE
jgi:hypothetical protein